MIRFEAYIIALLASVLIISNVFAQNGPYFGNGMRNGWVDQHSAVLWSRLSEVPDLKQTEIKFIPLSREQHQRLRNTADSVAIHAAQIPTGHTLRDMHTAVPGMAGEISLLYYPISDTAERVEVDWQPVDPSKNYSLQWSLKKLRAQTRYRVILFARPSSSAVVTDTLYGSFQTAPLREIEVPIKFSVVTGHDYNRRDNDEMGHQIYHSMMQEDLDFYIHTGDIEYYDKPNPWAMTEPLMYFKWDRLFALPFQRTFYNQITSYFMKDDHDALSNDCFSGMQYGTVSFERGLQIFDQIQFPSNDSLYKTIRWGKDLQIWLVEGRNYRSKNSDPDGPGKTIWGKDQKEWFYQTMQSSDATFKVLITSTPILGPDRSKKNDNYANYGFRTEGDEIRSFINQFDNLFICTGDRHWQYVSHRKNSNLWEFSCGPGSDQHAGGWSEDNRLEDHRFLRVKGGYLTVQVYRDQNEAKILFRHHDVWGEVVHQEQFAR